MKRKKYTYEDVKEIVENANYKLLSTKNEIINNKGYVLTSTKIKVKCPNLNHKPYEVEFNKFKGYKGQNPTRCKQCLADELRKSYEEVKKYFEKFEYKLLSTSYKTGHDPLKIQCPKGHITDTMTYSNFKIGNKCSKCAEIEKHNKQRHDYEYVKEYIESFGYKLLSTEYETARKPLLIQCDKGHKPYSVRFDNFRTGYRCPYCNVSKGERKIIDWLEENNIKYIYDEPYFNDLLSPLGNPLRPDFIIEDKRIWIEYDGELHFNKYYEGQKFEETQIHDKLKDEYASKNRWELIRIPYWDYDRIGEILKLNLR